jgi:hypothetical protein
VASVVAIVSKPAFAKLRGREGEKVVVGSKTVIERYDSQHPQLESLTERDALWLVTVQPDDRLWLVAMLTQPAKDATGWVGRMNYAPTIDLTPLCAALGLQRGDGKLAMRLQTPRVLDERAVAILERVEYDARRTNPPSSYVAFVPQRILKMRAKAALSAKAARRPKVAKGAFAFFNRRAIDADGVLALDAVHQAQFIETIGTYAGIRLKTAKATLDAYLAKDGVERAHFSIDLWDVIEGGRDKPRFEYWVQGAGDGTLFTYGTDDSPHSIGSTQHAFESHDDETPRTRKLVAALQKAADKTSGL